MNSIKILDCTLRDGGYYNDWRFSKSLVSEYIKAVNNSNIDIVEIGFRFLKKNNYGFFANTEENLINNIKFRKNLKVAVMLNSADLSFNSDYKNQLKKYFVKKSKSKISVIRLATHLRDIEKIVPHVKFLKKLGYNVVVNLMQIDKVDKKDLIRTLKILKKTNSVTAFYFADSFGNLDSKKIEKICKIIKFNWNKDFGFHAHDNCGFALQNCLTAMSRGAKWIDSTIQGMGRGAGNVSTEDLLCALQDKNNFKYNVKPIFNLAQTSFRKLKDKYKWGKSIYYHMSAKFNIHPTYIQELTKDDRYSHEEIINIIYSLRNFSASSFNPERLKELIQEKIDFKSAWNAKDWCKNKNILLLGAGSSITRNKEEISKFIKKRKCKVVSLNINEKLDRKFINFYVACNEARMLVDYKKYKKIYKKLILPKDRINKILGKKLPNIVKNYGMLIKKNKFKVYEKYCELPNSLAIGYALSICITGNAKQIYLAGFDGYKKNSPLNKEINNYLKFIKSNIPQLELISLTPTHYAIKKN